MDRDKLAERASREARIDSGVRRGAGWFFIIGSLSILSKLLSGFGISFDFLFGLGTSHLLESLLAGIDFFSSAAVFFISLLLNTIISSVLIILGSYAEKALAWAFISGLIFYFLDLMLLLAFGQWFAALFHCFALYGLYFGYQSLRTVEYINVKEVLDYEKLKKDNPELIEMMKDNPALNKRDEIY